MPVIDLKTKWISALSFTVSPDDQPQLAHEAALVMQRIVPVRTGFIQGVVMANEPRTQLIIVSQWESREAWAAARWDEGIASAISRLVESRRRSNFIPTNPLRSFADLPVISALVVA